MKSNRGMSLIAIVVGTLLAGIFLVFVAQVLYQDQAAQKATSADSAAALESATLLQHVLQVGRLAQSCVKINSAAPAVILQCEVDYNVPSTGTLTTVRFIWDGSSGPLRFQTLEGTAWKDTLSYGTGERPIVGFQLCATSEMASVSPTCSLQPLALSRGIGRLIASMASKAPPEDYNNRFFRFAISVAKDSKNDKPPYVMQSAFFLRNPPSVDGLTYQWGTIN